MLHVLAVNFASQGHLPGQLDDWFAGLVCLIAVGGALAAKTSHKGLTLVWLLLPLAAVYGLSFKEPLFSPRYFIVVLPALLLLMAAGLAALPAPATFAGLAVLSAGSVWAIERGQTVPVYAKEDYRTAANYVAQRSGPNDAIVLVANYIEYPFEYYFHGAGHVIPLDVQPDSNVEPLLAPLASYDHIWLVEAHDVFVDPADQVGKWLRARYAVGDEQYIIAIHFTEFVPHPTVSQLPAGARSAPTLGAGPVLAGYQTLGRPGGELVTLYWQTQPHPAQDFHLSLKLWRPDGTLAGQRDGEPLNAGLPFTRFPAGGLVRDEHFVPAAIGVYDLRLSVYPPGQVDVGQVDLGQVSVPSG